MNFTLNLLQRDFIMIEHWVVMFSMDEDATVSAMLHSYMLLKQHFTLHYDGLCHVE